MPIDYKKVQKELYVPSTKASLITVPKMNFISVSAKGNPNEEGGAYQRAVEQLYSIAYTIRMSKKAGQELPGYQEFVVPPLEGLWWQDGICGVDLSNKDSFSWISLIRMPDFVNEKTIQWAKELAKKNKKDAEQVKFLSFEEGLCVQVLHIGPYATEAESVAKLDTYIAENNLAPDFSDLRQHHEIYLSNPQRVAAEKLKTVIRHPVKKL